MWRYRWAPCLWGLLLLVAPLRATVVALQPADNEGRALRWLDIADHPYAPAYQTHYTYQQARVLAAYEPTQQGLRLRLLGAGLKPFFCYQLKLESAFDSADAARLGHVGRWWREEWNHREWSDGTNLNDKGDGHTPTPNDRAWALQRDVPEPSSPTGRRYRFKGYVLFGLVVTDAAGGLDAEVLLQDSYHAVFKDTQRAREADDSPFQAFAVSPDPALSAAYAAALPSTTVRLFAEWERRPKASSRLPAGDYRVLLLLGEESFHGSGGAQAGDWARAMCAELRFTVAAAAPVHDAPGAGQASSISECSSTEPTTRSTVASEMDQSWNTIFDTW